MNLLEQIDRVSDQNTPERSTAADKVSSSCATKHSVLPTRIFGGANMPSPLVRATEFRRWRVSSELPLESSLSFQDRQKEPRRTGSPSSAKRTQRDTHRRRPPSMEIFQK